MSEAAEPTRVSFWESYRRLFDKKGSDWWSIVFGYPIGRFLVLLLPRGRWVTPTLITLLGFATRLVGSAALLFEGRPALVVAVVFLQATTVLDCMDGTLARSRKLSSLTGAFMDKVFDGIGLFVLCAAIGVRAFEETGELWLLPVACSAGAAYLAVCYAYWVARSMGALPASPAASFTDEREAPTWSEIAAEWAKGWVEIVRFNEADLYLWICLLAALDAWLPLVLLLALTQGITLLKKVLQHTLNLRRMDRGEAPR